MNFRLDGEFVDKHASSRSCLYCGKNFDDNQALDIHHWIHQEIDKNSPESLSNVHQSSTVACNPTPLHSNAANEASGSRSTGHSPGVSQNRILLSPDGVASHHNRQTSVALAAASGDALKRTQGYNLCPPMFSSMGAVCPPERSLSMDRSKRPYVAGNSGNADGTNELKKARISPDAHVEADIPQLRELPLLDNFVEYIPDSGPYDGAEDVDLSLHL